MSTVQPEMSAAAVSERLRAAARLSDLRIGRRLDAKLDMSAAGVTARLREASALLALCRRLEEIGRANGLGAGAGEAGSRP